MHLSFIIPCFNNVEISNKLWRSFTLTEISSSLEVIFINDASTDQTSEWLSSLCDPCVSVLNNSSNLGYAKSNNIGINQASGDILILLNNDLEFDGNWLEPLLSILELPDLNAGIVGNIQLRMSDNSVDHAGFELTPQGKFVHKREQPNPSIKYSKVPAVTGACLAIRKCDFEAVGGFDETFLNGGEDVDLCFKIAALGKSIYVSHESQIKHHVALSRDPKSSQNEKNSQYLFQKWRSEIKNELSKIWQPLLSSERVYSQNLDGTLKSTFLTSPSTATRIISENILSREEHRWSRDIDGEDLNANISKQLSVRGTRYNNTLLGYLVDDEIELSLTNVTSIQNFYVCGRRLNEAVNELLEITISVNGIQEKIFTLCADRHLNVGIINPLLFNGVDNILTVSIRRKSENGLLVGSGKSILITHFVIDEKTIDQF